MSESSKAFYGETELPEFRSTIPAHLLGKLSDSERWIIETMSRMESQSSWLVERGFQGSRAIESLTQKVDAIESWRIDLAKKIDAIEPAVKESKEKVNKLWDWHQMLSGKWAVLWTFLVIIATAVIKFLIDLIKKGP